MFKVILLAPEGSERVEELIRRLQERINIDLCHPSAGSALNVAILCITGPRLSRDVETQVFASLRARKKILPVLLTDDAVLPTLLAGIRAARYSEDRSRALDDIVTAVKLHCR